MTPPRQTPANAHSRPLPAVLPPAAVVGDTARRDDLQGACNALAAGALLKPLTSGPDAAFDPPEDGYIHISPLGRYPVTLEDGGAAAIVIDPESCDAQAAAFAAEAAAAGGAWGGLLVDFDHFSLDSGRSSEAAGWCDALEARPDGLWARVRWTDSGLAAIRGGRYRYSSPVHLPAECSATGRDLRPRRLHRLALTNDPRMLNGLSRMRPISSRSDPSDPQNQNQPPADGGQKGPTTMDYKAMLLKTLGLPADADDAAVQAAADARAAAEAEKKGDAISSSPQTDEEKDALISSLREDLDKARKDLAACRADASIAELERDGVPIASRDNVRKALIADHANTLAAIRAVRPAAPSREPFRSRATALPPAAAAAEAEREKKREQAVQDAGKTYRLKSRADAVARAQLQHPELWA